MTNEDIIKRNIQHVCAITTALAKPEDLTHLLTLSPIKKVCFILNMTYEELADKTGLVEGTIKKIARTNVFTKSFSTTLLLYMENILFRKELNETREFKQHLKNFLKE